MSDKHEWVPIILQWAVSGYMKICIAADTQPLDFFQYLLPCPFTMGGCVCVYTWYVSHRRIVQRSGSSLISRLFIQRKANCRYSTSHFWKCRCTSSASGQTKT